MSVSRSRRTCVLATMFALCILVFPSPVMAQSTQDDPPEAPAPGLGNIVGSPDPGPKPTDAGDRGGAAQLVLAGVMFGGIGFIGWRIYTAVSTAQSQHKDPR